MHARVTLVGGPTALLEAGGLRILTDPTFDPPQTYTDQGRGGRSMTKTAGPALQPDDVTPVDVALVSHDHHIDNLDTSGRTFLSRVPTVLTTVAGAERLGPGVTGLEPHASVQVPSPDGSTVTITAVPAEHGPDGLWQMVGPVVGFVISGPTTPTVYVSGDNASLDVVSAVAERYGQIDIALLFTGGARFTGLADGAYLTLSSDAAVDAARRLDGATVIPVHADSWAHFTQDQDHTHAAFTAAGLEQQVTILHPGESVSLSF